MEALSELNAWVGEQGTCLTFAEAASVLGLTRTRVSQLLKAGDLEYRKFYQTIAISATSLMKRKRRPSGRKRSIAREGAGPSNADCDTTGREFMEELKRLNAWIGEAGVSLSFEEVLKEVRLRRENLALLVGRGELEVTKFFRTIVVRKRSLARLLDYHEEGEDGEVRPVAWHREFLMVLRKSGTVKEACAAVGVSRQTAAYWYHRRPTFRQAWERALSS